jgi:hypothetical protein
MEIVIYEQIINGEIQNEISGLDNPLIDKKVIDPEEAPRIIAKYISNIVKKGLENIKVNASESYRIIEVQG